LVKQGERKKMLAKGKRKGQEQSTKHGRKASADGWERGRGGYYQFYGQKPRGGSLDPGETVPVIASERNLRGSLYKKKGNGTSRGELGLQKQGKKKMKWGAGLIETVIDNRRTRNGGPEG